MFNSLPEGGVEDGFQRGFSSLEDERFGIFPAFRRVKKEGGSFRDFFETNDGEFLVGSEFCEVKDFEFKVEVVGDIREFGWCFTGGDQLETKGISLPSFEGVAENGDLAGEGLKGDEKEEEELHGLAVKVWIWPRSVETMRRPSAGVRP